MKAALLCLVVGLAATLPASAMYKCEQDGRVAYTDTPCEGGKLLDLKTSPATEEGDAKRQAAREMQALNALERDRHKREAADERESKKASRESAARHRKCAAHARRERLAIEDVRRSTGIANEKARRKAERVRADYEAECGRWYERELSLAR